MFSKHSYMVQKSRELRHNGTEVEKKIWHYLRNKGMKERFYRQHNIEDKYIVDFYCAKNKLIIEIDGGCHCENKKDIERDTYLKRRGYCVMRFWNNEVIENIEGCLEKIRNYLI